MLFLGPTPFLWRQGRFCIMHGFVLTHSLDTSRGTVIRTRAKVPTGPVARVSVLALILGVHRATASVSIGVKCVQILYGVDSLGMSSIDDSHSTSDSRLPLCCDMFSLRDRQHVLAAAQYCVFADGDADSIVNVCLCYACRTTAVV